MHEQTDDNDDASAAVHRRLSDAGIQLSEAHAHLSAIRTQLARDDFSKEVADAETEALVASLETTRDHIDNALGHAREITASDETEGDETSTNQPAGDETAGDGETSGADTEPDMSGISGSKMLWNTASPDF
jgi:hypothetical protein